MVYKNLSLLDIEGEIWKDIIGWEGLYAVSSKGRLKSIERCKTIGKHGKKLVSSFIMKQNLLISGRLSILLWRSNYEHAKWGVHRLVGVHFIPNPENKPTINHIDGNPLNNDVINLEWATLSENQLHAVHTGLRNKSIGENSNFSKLTKDDVLNIREKFDTKKMSRIELATEYGMAKSTIQYIVNRETWKHLN